MKMTSSRREFLKTSAATGVGFTIAFHLPIAGAKTVERMTGVAGLTGAAGGVAGGIFEPNAFLRIKPDNTVTVVIKHLEMGQGVYTGLAMVVAEELGADWSKIRVESAPADAARYKNLFFGMQGTGGSSSMANSWQQLRDAGAMAREMLANAAAVKWKVERKELTVENGKITHVSSKRQLTFGALAALAAKQTRPAKIDLKAKSDFKIIGQEVKRLDNVEKTSGQAQFSMDVIRPNQLTALIARPPRFGAKVKSVKPANALKIPGVKEVLEVPSGVAVLADSFWSAKKGRDALEIDWDESKAFQSSTDEMRKEYRGFLAQPGVKVTNNGDAVGAAGKAKKKINAEFEFPYLAHAPMEPLNCVIQVKGGKCEIWSGSQMQTGDQMAAATILGLKPENVAVHTMLAGGSFGRRATLSADLVSEASWIAKKTKNSGRPIHLMWTREDDIRGGYYRPFFMHKVDAGIDNKGNPVFWNHRIAGQSFIVGTPMESMMMKEGFDPIAVEGVSNLSYAVPNLYVDLHMTKNQVPTLWWRSVGHTHTAFAAETIIDELAELAGADPVDYRMKLLEAKPRHQGVLKLAAEKAGWGQKPRTGIARGVAVHESFRTFVAAVVDVAMSDGKISVDRVVCAVDCGVAINPDNVRAQMEGGLGFGLGAALNGAITFEGGKVVQSNFHDYKTLRIDEMPKIEVHIVPSDADPTGVGEPGVPVIAPAVANAVAKLTGKRLRTLPLQISVKA